MHQSRINPKFSAYEQMEGTFEYNKMPFAPPEIKVIAYETYSKSKNWVPYGIDAWYLAPTMEHYRCFRIVVRETGEKRISDMF